MLSVLLDSIEDMDSVRIARPVDYISDYADDLVVALLEDMYGRSTSAMSASYSDETVTRSVVRQPITHLRLPSLPVQRSPLANAALPH